MTDLADLGVVEAAAGLARGEFSARELAQSLLERAAHAKDLNAFVWLDESVVLAAADVSDARRASGAALGPLDGVPVTLKDNIESADAPTTAGSNALRDFRPARNAPVVVALQRAGAVMFGKNGLHEFAFGVTSNNGSFGAIRNPYARDRSPGGSSGGTGVAVAARLACAGIGTDTGGSVRIPSAFCGLYGYRPTLGRWPAAGVVPISRSRDTPGPLARSMKDIAALDAAVTGETAPVARVGLKGVRFGVPHRYFWDDLDSEVEALATGAMERLRAAGAEIVEVEIVGIADLAQRAAMPIVLFEAREQLSHYLSEAGLSLTQAAERVGSPDVKAVFQALGAEGGPVSRADYEAARGTALPALRAAYAAAFNQHRLDALVYPLTPIRAPAIGEDETVRLNDRAVPTFSTLIRHTDPAAAASLAALSIPIGLDSGGVPVGLGVDAPPGGDRDLLALGLAMEDLFPPLRPA